MLKYYTSFKNSNLMLKTVDTVGDLIRGANFLLTLFRGNRELNFIYFW